MFILNQIGGGSGGIKKPERLYQKLHHLRNLI